MKTSFSNYLRYQKVRRYLDLVNYAEKKLARELKDAIGFSLRECKFLLQVDLNRGCSLTKIQKMQYLPSSTAAWLADRLVQKGLLIRKQNPQNRREVTLDLSPEGLEVVGRIHDQFFTPDVEERLASVKPGIVEGIEASLRTLCRLYGLKTD